MVVLKTEKPKAINLVPTLKKYFQEKLAAELGPHDLKHLMDTNHTNLVILDVRSAEGFREEHIPGAINIPFEELTHRFSELSKDKELVAYCWHTNCLLATRAAYLLNTNGFLTREMIGGIDAWITGGFSIEK